MQDFTITNAGKQLMARMIAGATTANFTKVAASDHDYSGVDLETLTELQDIKQEVFPSDLSVDDATSIKVTAVFDNSELTQRYYVRAVGLYAEETDGTETLYAVSICDETPDSLPAFGGKTVYSLTYSMYIRVDSTEQITLELNPLVYITAETLTRMINETKALRATSETYGMAKLSDSAAVTDSTGLVLAATEKNATIEGTLANQLSRLNTEYTKLSRGIRFYNSDHLPDDYNSDHLPGDITISSDGEWFVFNNLWIYEGDLVILSGTCNIPYGTFGVMMQQGNYTPISFGAHGSNSIDASNIMLNMDRPYSGNLRLRVTAPGTKLSDNSRLYNIRITVISCRSFYL